RDVRSYLLYLQFKFHYPGARRTAKYPPQADISPQSAPCPPRSIHQHMRLEPQSRQVADRPPPPNARFACQTGLDNANLPVAESGAGISPWRRERIVVARPRQIDDLPCLPRPIYAPLFRYFFAKVLALGQVLR